MNLTEKYYTDKEFEDILNEVYGTVEIAGMTFDTGRALKELDPTAFDCANNDYFDSTPRYECEKHGGEFDSADAECPECVEDAEKSEVA